MPETEIKQESSSQTKQEYLEAIQRVAASPSFVKAQRLSSLLHYIGAHSLDGQHDALTEQQIGIHVFNRPPGYNSSDDNIVRGTARHLRQRLALYYEREGVEDTVRIEIPKGSYVAHFRTVQPGEAVVVTEEDVPQNPSPRIFYGVLGTLTVLVCILAAVAAWLATHRRPVPEDTTSSPLWKAIFTTDKPTLLVAGDVGLNIFEVAEHRKVSLAEYTQGTYAIPNPQMSNETVTYARRAYVTLSDMQLVAKLTQLPEAARSNIQVRYARDLAIHDLPNTNLVLMGSASYNPWVDLFQQNLDIQLNWNIDKNIFIATDRGAKAGEPSVFQFGPNDGLQNGLMLIALTNNTQGSGRVLLVEGATMRGIYGASQFLSNAQMIDPIIQEATRPDGSIRNFEVLLQGDFIKEGTSNLRVVAKHIH